MFDNITDSGLKRRIKQHVIGRGHTFFAVVQPGFENTAADELRSFGLDVSGENIEGGVEFTGRIDDCFTACIRSRTASRIVMRIAAFPSYNFYELEREIRKFPWELYLNPELPVNFSISARKSMVYHSGKLQEIFEREMGSHYRYSVDESADSDNSQTLLIRNYRDICTVSIDASGPFLYRRGNRKHTGKAPMRETLASLILLEAKINDYDLLLDPMCGSGVFSIEAASIFTDTAPNIDRSFAFMNWPSFKEKNYQHIKNSILSMKKTAESIGKKIICSDIDAEEIKIASENVPPEFKDLIIPEVGDFFAISNAEFQGKKTLIVMNPPYGKRIQEQDISSLYMEIGRKLKSDFSNCGYAVIVSGGEAEKSLSINYNRKINFMNGGIKASVLFRDL